MKIAAIQFDPQFGQVKENIERASTLIRSSKADLYVLPELCFSGYTFTSPQEAQSLSEQIENGFSIKMMRELAAEINSGIIFGFPEKAPEGLYNSCIFISPEKAPVIYRKIHLFFHEKDYFLPGNRAPHLCTFRGCCLGMMICFDWIFPEAARSLALLGAQLICHSANLVMPYCQAAMITRSLENRVFTITANRIGEENRGEFHNKFTGLSQIINPKGRILFRASSDKDEACIADIDYRESDDKAVNLMNNLWDDRQPQFYIR
jgi:predicted amidohydrolase